MQVKINILYKKKKKKKTKKKKIKKKIKKMNYQIISKMQLYKSLQDRLYY